MQPAASPALAAFLGIPKMNIQKIPDGATPIQAEILRAAVALEVPIVAGEIEYRDMPEVHGVMQRAAAALQGRA